jgi:DNA primase
VAFDADDRQLLRDTVAYYHERLKASPEALAYLQRRGLGQADALAHFRLGLADRSLGLRLPDKRRKAGADLRARLETLGLFRSSGHEHFAGSLVIPVFDEGGDVIEIYGRKIRDDLRAGTPKHLYLPAREGRSRGVFNVEALIASKEIILCEALIDALTFWCAGYQRLRRRRLYRRAARRLQAPRHRARADRLRPGRRRRARRAQGCRASAGGRH